MRRLALAVALSVPRLAHADSNPGVTAAPVLQIPMGSRALGMGGAFTAVASDVSALYYNPAGLSRLNAQEVAFTFISGLTDNNIQHAAYGGPLPFSGFSGNGYASFGTSLLFSQSGKIEVNTLNPDGSFQGSQSLSAGSDLVLTAAYAERVGSTPIDVKETSYGVNHFLGLSGKYIHSTLVQQYSASTFAADVGYLVNSPEAGLSLGMSVLNIGGQLNYISEPDPLPLTMRSGLAYQASMPGIHNVTLALDAEYLLHEKQTHIDAGLEYFFAKTYGVRLGYQFMRDAAGLTVGLGLRWRSRVLLDYAWAMADSLHDSHRFTISYRFGGVTPAVRGRERRPFIEAAPEHEEIKNLNERTPLPEPSTIRPRPIPREEHPQGIPGWIY